MCYFFIVSYPKFGTHLPDISHSHAQARQMLMANGIVEVIEHAKVAFRKERDIVATTRAMLNIIAVDYS